MISGPGASRKGPGPEANGTGRAHRAKEGHKKGLKLPGPVRFPRNPPSFAAEFHKARSGVGRDERDRADYARSSRAARRRNTGAHWARPVRRQKTPPWVEGLPPSSIRAGGAELLKKQQKTHAPDLAPSSQEPSNADGSRGEPQRSGDVKENFTQRGESVFSSTSCTPSSAQGAAEGARSTPFDLKAGLAAV